MSTSGTVTYSVNESEIVKDALSTIGVLDPGETATAAMIDVARRKLNLIVKQWTAQLDFAPGLKMWTRREGYLFLQDGQVAYSLGPSGDHATESYARTTLTASAAGGASTIAVASATGIADTYYIAVELDSGALQWTTVSGAPSGLTVTLAATLTGAASSGNSVFCYQTKIRRPFKLETAVLRDVNGKDVPMDVGMLMPEYEAIYDKTAEGTPCRLYFEAQRTNAKAFIDCAPEDATKVIRVRYLSYVEDFSAQANDADFPAEWAKPLILQLANDCCRPFGRAAPADLKLDLQEALAMARKAYPENIVLSYESDPDSY